MNTNSNHPPNLSFISLQTILMALGSAFAPLTFASGGNWTNDAAGNWNTAANWSPNAVPGTAAGDVVGLTTNITAARIVTLDTAATVGTLNIGDPISSYFGYTLSGSSTLTFDNSGSGANLRQLTAGGANDTLSVPITLADNLTIFNVNGLTISGVISGSGKGITKAGTGTLTLNGSAVNTYTGSTTVSGGTTIVDFANLATPTDLINSGSALVLGGGKLQIKQKSATTSSQTFANTTLSTNSSTAVIGTQVTSGALTVNLGTITNNGGTVDFTLPTGGNIAVTNTISNGILGGWATMGNNVASGTVGDWATTNGSGNITAYTGYTSGTPSGVNNANNYKTTGAATISANATVNSLIISGAGGDTTVNATLTLNSGGLFIGGSQRWLAGSGTIKSGLASGELYLHCNGSGYTDYQIKPDIADGTVATKVIKDGPGVLKFWGGSSGGINKTYTGGTVVNGGTLQLSFSTSASGTGIVRGPLTINPGATVEMRDADVLGYTSASVSVTNVTINGGTLTATAAGNQGYYAAFNLTGGTMGSTSTYKFGSAANCAINSFASPIASTISGAITLAGDITSLPITVASGTVPGGIDLTISGAIGGSGYGITKSGAGTLQLSTANTYSGATTVNGGTLYVSGSLRSSASYLVQSNSTLKVDASNVFTTDHGTAMGNTRTITVDNATLLMDTSFQARFGNVTLRNGATWTCNRSLASYDALLANTSAGAATVLVTNTSGTAASTMNGATGIRLQGVQNFDVADVTGDSSTDLLVSMILSTQGTQGGAAGGINKLGLGTMTFAAANTYSNDTTINAGTLALSGSGSITNSTNIVVMSGATFDVSGGSFTLGARQALRGAGTVNGTVTVASGGTITSTNMSIGGLTYLGTATNNFNSAMSTTTAPLTITGVDGLNVGSTASNITINIPTTPLAAGTYHLIAYSGTIQGSAGINAFKLGTNPGGSIFSYTIVDNGGYVDLQVTALADVWTGAGSTEWSTATLGTKNWKYAGSPADYQNGKDVIFDDTVTGTTTVDLSVADVTPASVLFNNVNSNYTLQGTAAIAGSIGLTKTGAGTVTINNTNKFVGAVSISAGTVAVGNIANKGVNSALGAGTNITVGGATLSYTGGPASSDRPITMTSSNTLKVPSGGTSLTLAGAVSGAFTLTKTGAGTLVLDNTANSYGATTMNEGTVSVSNNLSLGSSGPLNFGGGTLALTGSSAISTFKSVALNSGGGTIQVDNTVGVTLNTGISGTGGLTKTGNGTLTLNTTETYSGGTTINAGVLDLAAGGGSAGVIRGTVTINTNGTLRLSTGDATGYATDATRISTLNITGGTLNVNSTANQTFGNCTVNLTGGAITASSTSCNLDFYQGSSAVNSYASAVASTISTTKLNLRQDNGVTFTVADGVADIDLDVTSVISASSGYTGNQLVKAGAGAMRLAGANTFAYPLNVGGGRLVLDGSLVSGCAVTVSNNATLGGSGTVNGPVTLQSGATLAAGGLGTNIGTLNIPNAITLNAGSTNYMRISKTGGTATNDQVKGWTGTLSYAGTLQVVDVTSDATPLAYNDKFILFKNGAGNYGVTSFATTNLPALPPGLKWDLAGLLVDGSILVAYENQATTPTINPGSGNYVGSPSVTISSDPGATILYTLDGSTPNSSSASGASPLIVVIPTDAITVLKAIATNSGAADSLMASATYNVVTTPTWTNLAGGSWTTTANWSNSVVATGTNVTADFSKLTLSAATAVTLDGARTIGNLTFGDVGNTYGWTLDTGSSGPLSLAVTSGSPTVNVVNQSATVNTVLAGTSGLTKTGSGLLTLGAINTYAGGTVVNDGALRLLNGGADAAIRGSVTVNPGANLRLSTVNALGYGTTATTVTNVNVVSGSVSNVTSGDQGYFTTYNLTGGSMQGGSGWWIFGSAANGGINSLASSNASAVSGNFYLKGDVANLPISTESGSVPGGVDLEISGNITGDSGKGMVKSGPGTLKLSSGSAYSGATIVSNGVLQLAGGGGGSSGALTNTAYITVASGAELQLNTPDATGYGVSNPLTNAGTIKQIAAFSETLNRPIILDGGTITSTASNVYNEAYNFFGGYIRTLAGTSNSITGVGNFALRTSSCYFTNEVGSTLTIACPVQGWTGTGTAPLNKTGAGTLVLSAANTYAGNTVISEGILALSGNGSIANTPTVTIATGATMDVSAITPSNYSLNSSGTLTLNINKTGATMTQGQVTFGSKNLTHGGSLNIVSNASSEAFAAGNSFALFITSGSRNGWFNDVTLPALGSGLAWDTNTLAGSGMLEVYAFTTMPLIMSVPKNSNAVVTATKLANHVTASRGTASAIAASATAVSGASASVNGSGVLTYTPKTDYVGNDSFTVTFSDGHGVQAMAVTVTVGPGDSVSPNLLGQVVSGDNFVLKFAGYPGVTYTVETNQNVTGPGWGKLDNVLTPTNGIISFTNAIGTNSLFFRTVWPSY